MLVERLTVSGLVEQLQQQAVDSSSVGVQYGTPQACAGEYSLVDSYLYQFNDLSAQAIEILAASLHWLGRSV